MKKIAKYFFAALAVASAVSCAKELTDDFRPADKVQQGKSYTFTATMADTKSVIDEETLEILWSGDENNLEYITVLEPAATGITAKAITYSAEVNKYEPTSVANFSQHNEEAAGVVGNTVFAVYPAGDWKSFSNADSLGVAVTFATEQNAVAGTYDPKAPVAVAYNNNVAENQDLHFQNTSALLKLQLAPTTGKVNTITVYSLGGETLAGEILLMNKGGVPSMVPVKETAKSYVNLNFKEYEAGATYYIAVAPATLSKGIALQFNGDEVQTYTISDEIVIERGMVYDLGVFACNEPEDAWYLIGDYNVGNANTLRKTEFVEVEGEDLLVAKDVTIRELQGFKVYNPSTGVTYYPEVNDLEVNEWFPLTKEAGYGYTSSSYNVYDVYVDYVNKEMTGILLVDAGSAVPGFALPEGVFMHTTEEAGSFALCIDLENEVLKQGQFYDDYAKYIKDPSMEGKWYEATKTSEFTITPETAMSGKITFSDQYGPVVVNYSNYCRDSISLVSDVLAGYEELRNCVIVDEEPEFAYPVPSGLFFYMSADYEKNYILDLGSEDGYTFRQGQLFMDYEVPSGAEEFYNFFGVNGDPYCQVDNLGEVYQINPESNTAGVIYVKIGKNYYQLNYSNYEFNNNIKIDSPEDMEEQPVLDENGEQMEGGWPTAPLFCTGLGLEFEFASPYPMEVLEAPRYFTYEIPAEMPTDYETPEGSAYTWFDESYSADMLIDFGEVITKAYNYSQAMIPEGGEEYPIEEIWWNPELAGYWVSQGEVYSDYTVMPTAVDAGIITFVKDVTNMWGETMTQYFRIEYSDLTAESVKLFSPSSFNIPVYDTETGDQVMNEMYEMPYSWDGIGLMSFDEDYNSLPVEVSLLEEAPSIYVEDNSKMTPDEAQWVIYDPAVAEYFVGVSQYEGAEARTLLNLGASDLSWLGGPDFAGSFIHIAVSYEDVYGESAAGVWMLTKNFGPTTPYEVIPSEEDPSSGKIVIKGAGMSEGLDLEDESEGEMAIYYMGYNPYGGMCYFDFSDFGLESEQPFLAFITPTKDLMMQ